jgi:hypothetical protein
MNIHEGGGEFIFTEPLDLRCLVIYEYITYIKSSGKKCRFLAYSTPLKGKIGL